MNLCHGNFTQRAEGTREDDAWATFTVSILYAWKTPFETLGSEKERNLL
jgi:hypothetical protein